MYKVWSVASVALYPGPTHDPREYEVFFVCTHSLLICDHKWRVMMREYDVKIKDKSFGF